MARVLIGDARTLTRDFDERPPLASFANTRPYESAVSTGTARTRFVNEAPLEDAGSGLAPSRWVGPVVQLARCRVVVFGDEGRARPAAILVAPTLGRGRFAAAVRSSPGMSAESCRAHRPGGLRQAPAWYAAPYRWQEQITINGRVLKPGQIDRIEIFTTDEPMAAEADVIATRRAAKRREHPHRVRRWPSGLRTAGCKIDLESSAEWHTAGEFNVPSDTSHDVFESWVEEPDSP